MRVLRAFKVVLRSAFPVLPNVERRTRSRRLVLRARSTRRPPTRLRRVATPGRRREPSLRRSPRRRSAESEQAPPNGLRTRHGHSPRVAPTAARSAVGWAGASRAGAARKGDRARERLPKPGSPRHGRAGAARGAAPERRRPRVRDRRRPAGRRSAAPGGARGSPRRGTSREAEAVGRFPDRARRIAKIETLEGREDSVRTTRDPRSPRARRRARSAARQDTESSSSSPHRPLRGKRCRVLAPGREGNGRERGKRPRPGPTSSGSPPRSRSGLRRHR